MGVGVGLALGEGVGLAGEVVATGEDVGDGESSVSEAPAGVPAGGCAHPLKRTAASVMRIRPRRGVMRTKLVRKAKSFWHKLGPVVVHRSN